MTSQTRPPRLRHKTSAGTGGGTSGNRGPAGFHRSKSAMLSKEESMKKGGGLKMVYVKDDAFSWLPARVVSYHPTDDPPTADVVITLPGNWNEQTIASPDAAASTGGADYSRRYSEAPSLDMLLQLSGGIERTIDLSSYVNKHLPRMNVDESGQRIHKSDIADLPYLHEAAILYNVKDRHARGLPYTRVNDIMVAMNPFQWIDGLYSQEKQALYANRLVWNAPKERSGKTIGAGDSSDEEEVGYFTKNQIEPHVYETSALAYKGLALGDDKGSPADQAILVSGESGAGKTETVKIVMRHLAMIQSMKECRPDEEEDDDDEVTPENHHQIFTMKSNDEEGVVTKVLESNSIFEAFGNAKTARNDNSSRFGKFTQLQFDLDHTTVEGSTSGVPHCALVGSYSETYLLEKSRVVGHDGGERTYHVFYQLLHAPEQHRREVWDGLVEHGMDEFKYVYNAGTHEDEEFDDGSDWHTTVGDLALFGLRGDELTTLMRALCIVMQLGNLSFSPDPENEDRTLVSSPAELDELSDLMGIDADEISTALTTRSMTTRGENFHAYLKEAASKDSCDALAKEIYAKVFDVIVRTINEATRAGADGDGRQRKKFPTISLLDLFGFESFDVNRFEQLCINYANEKLQQKYVLDNFHQVEEEYNAEGIELFDMSLVDNKDILEVVEGRVGIIATLNDECLRPNGNDSAFVYKIKTLHRDSPLVIQKKLHRPYEFGVQHFAGPVTYDARHFIERNNDTLPADLMEVACRCTNALIQEEFQKALAASSTGRNAGRARKSFSAGNTVSAKFRSQLVKMMAKIANTQTRYIRCIRPNKQKLPLLTDHRATMMQLTSAGLVTAITISRETFPDKLYYEDVLDRFSCLAPGVAESFVSIKEAAEHLVATVLDGFVVEVVGGLFRSPYACGKTRVYFRPGALERMEEDRMEYYGGHASVIQRWFRRISCRWKYLALKRGCILLQARLHGRIARRELQKKLRAVVAIQCWSRCVVAQVYLRMLRIDRAAVIIQTRYRGRKPKASMAKWRMAARVLQGWFRGRKTRTKFEAQLARCVEEARKDDATKKLQRRLTVARSAPALPQAAVKEITEESEKMLDYYRAELFKMRRQNGELKEERDKLKKENKKLGDFQNSFDAAITVSNRRIVQLGRSNQALAAEVASEKHKATALTRKLKHENQRHLDKVEVLKEEYEKELQVHEEENGKLKKQIGEMEVSHGKKINKFEKEMKKIKRVHASDVAELKEELENTQEVHNDYLSKLMDVLETAHASREAEAMRLTEEFEITLEEKDDEISRLKRDIKALKSAIHRMGR